MPKGKSILFFVLLLINIHPLSAQNSKTMQLGMEDMFEIAESNNRNLKLSDYDEQIAAEAVSSEKKKLLPSLDASASLSYLGNGWIADRDFSNGMKAPMPHFGNNFAVEAGQVIYAGGAINSSIENAKLNQVISKLDKDKNRQEIRFLLTGYYLELHKLSNQKKVYLNNIEQARKLLDEINAKYKQGTALYTNITRYELQLKSLELDLVQLENSISIINNELVTTLNLPKGTKIEIKDLQQTKPDFSLSEEHWQNLALQRSPAIKQLDLFVEQSKNREKIVKAETLPQLGLFAGNKLDGPITIEIPPIDKNFNYWYAGIGLKFNIASLYKSGSKINSAKLATKRTEERNELLRDRLESEINSAYTRYLETFKVHETQQKNLDLATQNHHIIRNRYVNDLVLITEMLDAENAKTNSELQLANAEINILFNHYKLKKLTGTL